MQCKKNYSYIHSSDRHGDADCGNPMEPTGIPRGWKLMLWGSCGRKQILQESREDRTKLCGISAGMYHYETRRRRGDLIETYKIITGKEKLSPSQFFHPSTVRYNTRGHSLKLTKQRSRLDLRWYFFSQRVINDWNSLPQHVVDVPTVSTFKRRLDKHWQDMSIKSDA